MTPHIDSLFGIVEQVFLLAFILMLLVGLAGGRSEAVIRPLFEIFSTMLSALMGLMLLLLKTLLSALSNIVASGAHNWLNSRSSSRHMDR